MSESSFHNDNEQCHWAYECKLDNYRAMICELLLVPFEDNVDLCTMMCSFIPPKIGRLEEKLGKKPGRATRIRLSEDNTYVLTLDDTYRNGHVQLWRLDDWSLSRSWQWSYGGANMAISPNNRFVALTAVNARRVEVWDLETDTRVLQESCHSCGTAIAFSPDSTQLAADWSIGRLGGQGCECHDCVPDLKIRHGHDCDACGCSFMHGHGYKHVRVFDLVNGGHKEFCSDGDNPQCLVWSADGKLLFIESGKFYDPPPKRLIKVWNFETQQVVKVIRRNSGVRLASSTTSLAVYGDSVLLCTRDGISLWNMSCEGLEAELERSWVHSRAMAGSFFSGGKFALMMDHSQGKSCWETPRTGNLTAFNLITGERKCILQGTPHPNKETHYFHGDMCMSKDNSFVFFTGSNANLQVYSLATQEFW